MKLTETERLGAALLIDEELTETERLIADCERDAEFLQSLKETRDSLSRSIESIETMQKEQARLAAEILRKWRREKKRLVR